MGAAYRANTRMLLAGSTSDAGDRVSRSDQRNQRRRSLFDAQDQVDRQREDLIGNIEGKLQQKTGRQELLALRWNLA